MNKTLQDRLVKELRLRGISTMEAGAHGGVKLIHFGALKLIHPMFS